jgi:Phosphatidylinositol 3- and 4-kinase
MASLTGRRERQVKKIHVRVHNVLLDKVHSGEFYSWTNLKELRNFVQKKTGIAPNKQRLFHHHNELLNNQKTLEDLVDDEEEQTTYISLTLRYDDSKGSCPPSVRPFMTQLLKDPNVMAVVQSITKGFHRGFIPKEVKQGLSGSYFLRGADKEDLCIFKPYDEEPYAPNNPKGFVGKLYSKGVRNGVLSGEGAAREVAAYLIDSMRMHRVPETFFAEVEHPFFERSQIDGTIGLDGKIIANTKLKTASRTKLKFGSLQLLKKNNGTSDDFSVSLFPLEQMQAIAALDIRILNSDRNTSNILVKRRSEDGRVSIYPIDHSLSFPDNLSIMDYEVCWTVWSHLDKPTNPKLKEYILSLNPKENCKMLKKLIGMRPICLRNYRIAETLLIKGTQHGLTLNEIGKILYKSDSEETSLLEEIVKRAEETTMNQWRPALQILNLTNATSKSGKQSFNKPKKPDQDMMCDMKTDVSDTSNGGAESSDYKNDLDLKCQKLHNQPSMFTEGLPSHQDLDSTRASPRKRAQSCLPDNDSQISQTPEFDWENVMQLTPVKTLVEEHTIEPIQVTHMHHRNLSLKEIGHQKTQALFSNRKNNPDTMIQLEQSKSAEDKSHDPSSITGRRSANVRLR